MTKKRYCQKCQKLIEEGKEIKVQRGTNYRHFRYSSGPRDYIIYYLCGSCYQQYREEIRAEKKEAGLGIGLSFLWIFLVIILTIILFSLYNRRQEQKIAWLTKKAQHKAKKRKEENFGKNS